jgi:hypothetical protein
VALQHPGVNDMLINIIQFSCLDKSSNQPSSTGRRKSGYLLVTRGIPRFNTLAEDSPAAIT